MKHDVRSPAKMHEDKTVVSVTPTRIQADSRSFKVAASIARLGCRSIVVEGDKSELDGVHLPFELRSMGRRRLTDDQSQTSSIRTSPDQNLGRAIRNTWTLMRNRVPLFPIFPFLLRYVQRSFMRALRYTPRASLYYVHGVNFCPAVSFLCMRYRVPLIYDAHDFYAGMLSPMETNELGFTRRWIMAFYRYLESRLIREASAVVTVSSGVAGLLHRTYGCNPIVVRNCHDLRLDQETSTHLRQVLGLSPDQFILVAVGNAKEGAAIREALDAMQELPACVHLVFLGKYFEPHLKSIDSRHLEDRVHVVPPVRPFEVVPFIRSADASIILYYPRNANYRNSLPNRFFQPLAAELPLLYPELPEIRRIAEKYEIGIPIDPQIPRSIADAVTKLLNDPSLLTRYKRNLRVARDELSWEREETILRDLISTTLSQ